MLTAHLTLGELFLKPKQIIIIRHGQSEANVNKEMYEHTPDHLMNLTEQGKEQCVQAAEKLKTLLNGKKITVWSSPYNRARQTAKLITSSLDADEIRYREDPRLREQEWGNFYSVDEARKKAETRRSHSYFFYRIEQGESGADVYDRLSTFLETMFRDFNRNDSTDSILISTHGITSLVFLMRFFHWPYEEYEEAQRFSNCGYVVLELDEKTDRYQLTIDERNWLTG